MKRTCMGIVAAAAVVGGSSIASAATAIDLNDWIKEGVPGNGNWTVQDGGASVYQNINGEPTFFVSPDNYINTTIRGTFKVETIGDDDYIGFVFGYQSPNSGTATDAYDFILFDWKQTNQDVALAGFSLRRVKVSGPTSGFWENNGFNTGFDTWGTDFGTTRGWADHTEYEFELVYQTNLIQITITGGTGAFASGEQIFHITPDQVGLASFPVGRFGFYNYSQEDVRYTSFTEEDTPVVPSPAAFAGGTALMGLLFGAKAIRRRRD